MSEHPAAPTMQGQLVAGKYELIRLVGQGGMGAVYEARNNVTLKRCAVKLLLSPELAGNPEMVQRFFREAQAGSVIESDHVVQIFDSGTDPESNYPYMVMELLNGEDVEHAIDRLGAIEPTAATKIIMQACVALAKAHQQGIIHRDVKPANLFLSHRDSGDVIVKILDFGIAKVKMENYAGISAGVTRTGSMLGTPIYMSPEQAEGSSSVDARSDVWSLGVVLYQALSGQLPYADVDSLAQLMVQILTIDLPPLTEKAPWVDAELSAIVQRCMTRDRTARFADAAELREALARIVVDGSRLTQEEIRGVGEAERAAGSLKSTLVSAQTQRPPPEESLPPLPRRGAGFMLGAIGLGVLALGAFAALSGSDTAGGGDEPAIADEPPAAVTAPPAAITPPPPPTAPVVAPVAVVQTRTFDLEVAPQGVTVRVAGEVAVVNDGKVKVTGTLGNALEVTLEFGEQKKTQKVAVTRDGLIPSKLELLIPVKKVRARATKKARAKAARKEARRAPPPPPPAKVEPPPEPKPKPKPKKKSSMFSNTGEFD